MSDNEKTLKLVTNLDRAGIEKRLVDARKKAEAAGLADVAKALAGVEGAPKAQIVKKVQDGQKAVAGKSSDIQALLDLVEINLPNLK